MRGWRAIVCATLIAAYNSGSTSAEPPSSTTLAAKAQWVRFEIIAGRLAARQARFNQTKTITTKDPTRDISETISISARQRQTCFGYERTCPCQYFTVDFINGDTVDLQCVARGDSDASSVYLRQDADRGITVVVRDAEREAHLQAPTIWHLMLAHPDECRAHVIPQLEILRPDWQLLATAQCIKRQMVSYASSGATLQRRDIVALVDRLGSHDHPTRRAADRELRCFGPQIIGYLRHINQDLLNAEQRLRTRRILRALDQPVPDTPQRVAERMMGDLHVWTSMLAAEDRATRLLAAAHLEHICGQRIRIDQLEEPESRLAHVERVQRRLGLTRK